MIKLTPEQKIKVEAVSNMEGNQKANCKYMIFFRKGFSYLNKDIACCNSKKEAIRIIDLAVKE